MPIRSTLSKQENTEVILGEVTSVDLENRRVDVQDRSFPYDTLVIATGARHGYFGRPEWEKHAPGLKSITDATHIRRKVLMAFELAEMEPEAERRRALLNFILVGGGPTGVEMAGSIAELAHSALACDFRHINPRSARVILLEAGPTILSTFPSDLQQKARRSLEGLGVEVRTGARVENVDESGVIANGERIEAKTVIWAAGVVASPAGQWLHAETDRVGRVKVNADLTLPGHPEIFVLGDTALAMGENGKPLPGVAPVAMQQGRFVARLILRRLGGDTRAELFHYRDKGNLATIGRSAAIADLGWIHLSGFIAWYTWLVVHIAFLIGFRNRLLVLIQWAWSYFTYKRGARLITIEEESPARAKQRGIA
jgi:NADH dehydrogenase